MKLLTSDDSSAEAGGFYRIDSDRRLRIEEYVGKVELVDLRSMLSSMASDPCWNADFNGLVDFSKAELDLSSNDVLRVALLLRHESNRSRGWLTYVVSDSSSYGIVRMLGHWARNTDRMKIFKSRVEADVWLDANRDQIPCIFPEPQVVEVESAYRNVG